jgi:hypothetical protein
MIGRNRRIQRNLARASITRHPGLAAPSESPNFGDTPLAVPAPYPHFAARLE